jgi:hypothetical protein
MNRLEALREMMVFVSFVLGAFRSTPEGRNRRDALRLQRDIERWNKDRYKFLKDLRRDEKKDRITESELTEKLTDWDLHNPEPK